MKNFTLYYLFPLVHFAQEQHTLDIEEAILQTFTRKNRDLSLIILLFSIDTAAISPLAFLEKVHEQIEF